LRSWRVSREGDPPLGRRSTLTQARSGLDQCRHPFLQGNWHTFTGNRCLHRVVLHSTCLCHGQLLVDMEISHIEPITASFCQIIVYMGNNHSM
jgi:hypothetical protein